VITYSGRAPGYTGPVPSGLSIGTPMQFTSTPGTVTIPGNTSSSGGFVSDALNQLGRSAVSGASQYVMRRLAGTGSEPPTGEAPIPGLVGDTCPDGSARILGRCVNPMAALPGGAPFISDPYGSAVKGQFGVALTPSMQPQTRLSCPRGMVLGMDDLCYNKRDLRKDERKWVPPRKPLMTGGDLNAIAKAARAAARVKVQQKRLEKLGLLKRPGRR
jgi:hypothetical protein